MALASSALSSEPPLGGDDLKAWLDAGHYTGWAAESGVHGSAGPHFGRVRAYLNSTLFDSMQSGNAEHPVGSFAVKALFGGGDTVRGWAAAIKTSTESGVGNNWYRYEYYDGRGVRDAQGDALCASCHSAGRDYVLTPWPLK